MIDEKIVIIGGGVVGASVAYHLTERGARDVVILEREDAIGRGSTGKATGGVRGQFETEINIRLSLYSLDFFSNWDISCGYEPRGYLFLATDQAQMDFLAASSRKQVGLGYDEVRLVDRDEIDRAAPGLNLEDVVGGSFGPRDGFIDPVAVLEGFMGEAIRRGAALTTAIDVTGILTERGAVNGVETSRGMLPCNRVVIANGAWAQKLAATAGVALPVEPLRRQIVWATLRKTLPNTYPMVIDLSNRFHFRPARGAGDEVLLAVPDPEERPGFSTAFDEAFIEKVIGKARLRAPFLADAEVDIEKCRAGLYETTPDHHAILGDCAIAGLYLACGFSGHGVMHSPATGRALAEIILDGESRFLDVSSLHLDRFANGRLLKETAFI